MMLLLLGLFLLFPAFVHLPGTQGFTISYISSGIVQGRRLFNITSFVSPLPEIFYALFCYLSGCTKGPRADFGCTLARGSLWHR